MSKVRVFMYWFASAQYDVEVDAQDFHNAEVLQAKADAMHDASGVTPELDFEGYEFEDLEE